MGFDWSTSYINYVISSQMHVQESSKTIEIISYYFIFFKCVTVVGSFIPFSFFVCFDSSCFFIGF